MRPKQQHATTLNSNYNCGELLYFKAELSADEPASSVCHHDTAIYAELHPEEAIDRSNQELFPAKPASHNTAGKRETFYIVSELPFFDIPPANKKGSVKTGNELQSEDPQGNLPQFISK